MISLFSKGRVIYVGLIFLAILMFVWPIPRTIAVRNISIALSVLIFGYLAFKNSVFRFAFSDAQKKVFVVLTASTLWFYLEAIVVSPETAWALKELMQWISAIVCFGLGFLVANIEDKKAKIVFLIVLSAIFVHIFYIDLFAIKYFVSNQGTLPIRIDGLTEGDRKSVV